MAEIAPARSRTDPPTIEERSSRPHRRLHASSFRSKGQWTGKDQQQQHHHLRHSAKDTIQSAAELKPIDHLLRREKKTADGNAKDSAASQNADASNTPLPEIPEKKVTKEDVAKARRDNARREEELRANLKSVEEIGMSSTRQLDDTYYTILEKASILRSTVASLQHLADESRRMHSSFQDETSKIEQHTKQNLNSFGNFDGQERTINELVNKLRDSRSNTDHLNARLESARLRVEALEKRDNVMEARRRTRWRIVWAAIAGVIALIIALVLAKHRKRVGDAVGQQLGRIGDLVDDVAAPVQARLRAPTEDPFLKKLFDDL